MPYRYRHRSNVQIKANQSDDNGAHDAAHAKTIDRQTAQSLGWIQHDFTIPSQCCAGRRRWRVFQHSGYDVTQIRVVKNINERRFARGASTITQQLAKNLYLSTSKNPLRKLHEFLIAQELERNLTKQRIFEIYLNVIEWGDGIYGIQAASETYFGKPASALLPEEGAILAAMIPNPRRYTPARNGKYLERRKNELLRRLNAYRFLPVGRVWGSGLRPIVYRQASAIP